MTLLNRGEVFAGFVRIDRMSVPRIPAPTAAQTDAGVLFLPSARLLGLQPGMRPEPWPTLPWERGTGTVRTSYLSPLFVQANSHLPQIPRFATSHWCGRRSGAAVAAKRTWCNDGDLGAHESICEPYEGASPLCGALHCEY